MSFFAWLKDKVRRTDRVLFFCTLALSLVGLITVAGCLIGERGTARALLGSAFLMQVAMILVGNVLMFFLANLDYRVIVDKFWLVMILVSAGLLAITLVFGSTGETMETSNKSWLTIPLIGIAIQPSEFVKILFICTFAKHLAIVREKINRPLHLLGLLCHMGLIVGLILKSGDLGVALVFFVIVVVMLFAAGLNLWYFAGATGLGILLAPYIWEFLREDQQNRIIYGFNPEGDPQGKGFQPLMSRRAVASGGFFGKGFTGGIYYQNLTTGRLTDYIFTAICEKFGFVGGMLVILLYAVTVCRLVQIARMGGTGYGRLICIGIAATFFAQVLESIGMCLAMLPVVGITLPLISCGGSSILATYLLLGFAQSVYVHRDTAEPSGPRFRAARSF